MTEQSLLTTFVIILAVVTGLVLSELRSIRRRLDRLEARSERQQRG